MRSVPSAVSARLVSDSPAATMSPNTGARQRQERSVKLARWPAVRVARAAIAMR